MSYLSDLLPIYLISQGNSPPTYIGKRTSDKSYYVNKLMNRYNMYPLAWGDATPRMEHICPYDNFPPKVPIHGHLLIYD